MISKEMIDERRGNLLGDLEKVRTQGSELEKQKTLHCKTHLRVQFSNVTIFLINLVMNQVMKDDAFIPSVTFPPKCN